MSWTTVNDQRNPPGDAQITYGITSAGGTFNLRSTGTVDYEVEWGDGTVERSTSNVLAHTYAAGNYVLKIRTSQQYVPYFNNTTDEDQITSVALVSDLGVGTDLTSAWYGANNMTGFDAASGVTSSVINFINTWRDCSSLTSFPLIDTSSGTSFFYAWTNCNNLTSFPLIDTSSGTNFPATWANCTSLTSFPLLDTSSGINFFSTWQNCNNLTSFSQIDTSSGTNFFFAWTNCNSLTSFPQINTSSGISFSNTWQNCTSLTSFPQINTSSGTNFPNTWQNCTSLTSFPQINTSSGTNFTAAWRDCSSLTTFPANVFDTTGTLIASAFNNAFANCALTAQSVENILVSLDTNGATGITLSINGGTTAGQSSWTAAATTAYNNLIAKGWTITANP